MTAKHSDPEYRANARIIRAQVAQARRLGVEVYCWRCGLELHHDELFDVGHRHPAGGHGLGNLAPEHRYRTPWCQGNRSAGGRLGRAIQSGRVGRSSPPPPTGRAGLPW